MISNNKQSDSHNLRTSAEDELEADKVASNPEMRNEELSEGDDPLVGTTIARHYDILSCRGKGGMSIVYRARDLSTGEFVAVKILLPDSKSREQTLLRFQREARLAGCLDHPNVIRIHAFDFTADRQPFLVMDYVEGRTLGEKITGDGPVPLYTSIEIFLQICHGLSHAHQKGILHRDLKPSNVMLLNGEPGHVQVKILDFGIAKLLDASSTYSQQLTRTGDVFGSPLYMSPEQGLGKSLSVTSDIYSMGCLMFETLSGAPPFLGKTTVDTILKHQTERPLTLREAMLGAEFPLALENIVAKCLAKIPAERYQSAQELAQALTDLRSGKAVSQAVQPTPAKKALARLNLPVVVSVAGVTLIVAIAAVLGIRKHAQDQARVESDPPAAQTIQDLPKLTKEEQDDAKVIFDLKYLSNSTRLDYRGYKITNQAFVQLEKMRYLTDLDLGLSSCDDTALKTLSKLEHLSNLRLGLTSVTDDGLKYLQKLPLTYLDLGHTKITDKGIAYLKDIQSLGTLHLHASEIDDGALADIGQLKRLHLLSLSNTNISDAGLADLAGLKKLDRLEIADTKISDAGLKHLKSLKSLDYLDLQGTKITDSGLDYLAPLNKLNVLKLGRTKITDAGLAKLLKLQSMRRLMVDHTLISDNGLPLFAKFKHLISLNVLNCPRITKAGLAKLKQLLPGCQIDYVPLMNRLNGEQDPTDD